MGIYGALATAVTGLRAQSFALENISGNIANSQTTGYKRIETGFIDLIPDAPLKQQVPGAVLAQSRATNTDSGDIVGSSIDTFMALNGDGFFVVEERIGQNDGNSVFGGASYYTRRGDFNVDKEGYLVNGAGYFLKGLPVDSATGNVSGSVPEVIKLSNSFLPAQQTNRLEYKLNLPQLPKNAGYDVATPNSELLNTTNYATTPPNITTTVTGTIATAAGDAAGTLFVDGETLSFTVGGVTRTFGFQSTGAPAVPGADVTIDTTNAATDTVAEVLATIQSSLQGLGSDFATATVALSGTNVRTTLGTNLTSSLTLGGTSMDNIGVTAGPHDPTTFAYTTAVPFIEGSDGDNFLRNSIAGGAVTVFASNGSPVNVQFRWAKMESPAVGGQDRWNLFYLEDSAATGTAPMWRNVGQDYEFNASGAMSPSISSTTISNLKVNNVLVGNVDLQHNTGGVTQFADPNGTAKVTTLQQNGFAAGKYISVTVNEAGRVVATYTNGQQVELAQVVVAKFNSPNSMKRLDGGLFAATSESGEALLDSSGGILGGSLEASNTDISEEFTKLIVTQQAYAAGTRIVSTSNEMLQEALNMVR